MSPKPIVKLTEKDKKELNYLSDSKFCETFKSISNFISIYSLPIKNLNLSAFSNKQKCSKYYLILTPLFERDSFEYVTAKDAGFSIGTNCIEKLTILKGSIPRATFSSGAPYLSFDNKDYSFVLANSESKGFTTPITLHEEDYLTTWFLITKELYNCCCKT